MGRVGHDYWHTHRRLPGEREGAHSWTDDSGSRLLLGGWGLVAASDTAAEFTALLAWICSVHATLV